MCICALQGAVSGSVQASDRLMKELREIYRSQSYKTGMDTAQNTALEISHIFVLTVSKLPKVTAMPLLGSYLILIQ